MPMALQEISHIMTIEEVNEKISKVRREHQVLELNPNLNPTDRAYLEQIREILLHGEYKPDRTGTGTISIFGLQKKYDLRNGFPLLTTKKVRYDGILRELLWFLKGSTNINDDLTQYTPIWDNWALPDGELGPVYGYQWRKWEKFKLNPQTNQYEKTHIDQIANIINRIKTQPDCRRIILSAWNVGDIPEMRLPPCHAFVQFYVINGRLDCQLYQRSADFALGIPFNIASYSILMMMIAKETKLTPGIFTHTIGDAHIYVNHIDGLLTQLSRQGHALPALKITDKPFEELKYEDFTLENYKYDPFIKFEVAV
jgi:thymidylate synthase